MKGAIIGDIVGSRFEFNNTHRKDFELFTDECDFTDDTICTVAVADAILKDIPMRDSLLHWCHKYPDPMGAYGSSFSAWLYQHGNAPYGSFGNGAAMRVSPCAIAGNDSDAGALRLAYESAACTHNHAEGVIGALTVVRLMRVLGKGGLSAMDDAREVVRAAYGDDWRRRLPSRGVFDVTCQGCVPLAFNLIEQSNGFEDAVRNAVAYGGDSDTLAAIVGSLAEALFGVPADLFDCALTYLPAEMQCVVSEFYGKYQLR